ALCRYGPILNASTTRWFSGAVGSRRVNKPLSFSSEPAGSPVRGSRCPGAPDHSNLPPLATRIASSSSEMLLVRNLRSEIDMFAKPGAITTLALGYLSRTASMTLAREAVAFLACGPPLTTKPSLTSKSYAGDLDSPDAGSGFWRVVDLS